MRFIVVFNVINRVLKLITDTQVVKLYLTDFQNVVADVRPLEMYFTEQVCDRIIDDKVALY